MMMQEFELTSQPTLTSMQRQSTTTSPTCKCPANLKLLVLHSVFIRLKKQYHATNECIGRTGAGLKPDNVMPGSKIANIIGKIYFCMYVRQATNLTNCREGNNKFQVVVKATWVLVHTAEL